MSVKRALTVSERSCADAVHGMKAADRRRTRIDRGMCPECGLEAAPYYLCAEHRSLGALNRLMNKMASRNIVTKQKSGRENAWSIESPNTASINDFDWSKTAFDMDPNDKRLRPRINRRPVDLDETLLAIFRDAGKPLTMEEIFMAWGKLRSARKGSLASDMAAIIAAQRRRDDRARKRLALSPHLTDPIIGMKGLI